MGWFFQSALRPSLQLHWTSQSGRLGSLASVGVAVNVSTARYDPQWRRRIGRQVETVLHRELLLQACQVDDLRLVHEQWAAVLVRQLRVSTRSGPSVIL